MKEEITMNNFVEYLLFAVPTAILKYTPALVGTEFLEPLEEAYNHFIAGQATFISINYNTDVTALNDLTWKIVNEFVVRTIGKAVAYIRQNFTYFKNNLLTINAFNKTRTRSETRTETEHIERTGKTNDTSNNQNQGLNAESTLNNETPTSLTTVLNEFSVADAPDGCSAGSAPLSDVNVNTVSAANNVETNTRDTTSNNVDNTSRNHSTTESDIDQDLLQQLKEGLIFNVYEDWLKIWDEIINKYVLQIFAPFYVNKGWFF